MGGSPGGAEGGGPLGRFGRAGAELEGEGYAREDGGGQRTGGATRRDSSETELRRSEISLPTRELATWDPRS